jgi:hypothetical protein
MNEGQATIIAMICCRDFTGKCRDMTTSLPRQGA